jgi:hypothetical protein
VQQIFVFLEVRLFATITFSTMALEVPIALIGMLLYLLERQYTVLTPSSIAAVIHCPSRTLVLTASNERIRKMVLASKLPHGRYSHTMHGIFYRSKVSDITNIKLNFIAASGTLA